MRRGPLLGIALALLAHRADAGPLSLVEARLDVVIEGYLPLTVTAGPGVAGGLLAVALALAATSRARSRARQTHRS